MISAQMERGWPGLVTLAVLLIGSLAACGSAPPPPTQPAGPTPTVTAPTPLPIVISMAGRFRAGELAVLDAQIATFEEANPYIRVEIVRVEGDALQQRDTVAAWLADKDTGIDIYVVDDSWLAALARDDLLLPLDDYVESGSMSPGSFLPPAIQANTLDGQLLALPWTADGGMLYYRRDLLDKYGYQLPATWSELQRIALEIEAGEGLAYGFVWQGAATGSLTHNTLEFIWGYGGQVLDNAGNAAFDTPQNRAALAQMVDLVASGASPPDTDAYTEGESLASFALGEAVFMRNWSNAWERLAAANSLRPDQIGLAALPASSLFEQGLALSRYSLHPQQAVGWMAFLAAHDQQVEWAVQTGHPPALMSAYADARLLAARPVFDEMGTILTMSTPRPQIVPYAAASEAIYTEINRMLAGKQDVNTTVAHIQRRLAEILAGQSPD